MRTNPFLFAIVLSLACAGPKKEASSEIIYEEAPPSAPPEPAKPPPPPETKRAELTEVLHGQTVMDPYRWLEDEKSPEVQQWMAAQNAYARAQLEKLPARPALEQRLRDLLYFETVTAPVLRGGRLFYKRKHADKEKAVAYWRPADGSGEEKVLLDPNKWSRDGSISLGEFFPSWDGKWAAFLQKPNAADEATLRVAQVESGGWTKIQIEGAKYADPSWTLDNLGFYYEWVPPAGSVPVDQRPGKLEIRYHKLGADPATDEVVFPATNDPQWLMDVYLSRDGKYLFVDQAKVGGLENVIHYKQLGKDKKFKVLVSGKGKGARYAATAWKDTFYIYTTEGSGQGRVFKVPAKSPARNKWKEIIKEDPKATIASFNLVGGAIALEYLVNANSQLKLFNLDGKPIREVKLPGVGSASNLVGEPDEDTAFYSFSSFTQPYQVFQTSVKTGESQLWGQTKINVDPSPYTTTQVWYPSKDGTQVPMFIVHKKDAAKDGNHPVLLYGYGGFNIPMVPGFAASIYPWLEAGGVYAVANLRGGSEFGEAWHKAGMLHNKQNVFDDFIAAAEYLVKDGWTKPERLAIRGGSNGGLLVGAAMVQRPDLFGAVINAVPLLDMVRYHLFGSGRTWIPEYGTAEKADDFKVLHAYSPYHQVKQGQKYPPMMMQSADHDDRVDPMHARKFVAAIQWANPENVALLRIEENAGHGGADQVRRAVDLGADTYAWLFHTLKMEAPKAEQPPAQAAPAPPAPAAQPAAPAAP